MAAPSTQQDAAVASERPASAAADREDSPMSTAASVEHFKFSVDGHSYSSTLNTLDRRSFASHEAYSEFLTETFHGDVPQTKYRSGRSSPVWKYLHKLDVPQVNRRKKVCEYVCVLCADDGTTPWEDCLIAMYGNRSSNGATHLQSRHKDLLLTEDRQPADTTPSTITTTAGPVKKQTKRQYGQLLSPPTPPRRDAFPIAKKRKSSPQTTTKKAPMAPETTSSDSLTVHKMTSQCPALDETNLLASLVYPLSPNSFMDGFYQKKALAIHAPSDRFEQLIHQGLEDLDIKQLLTTTSSEELQAWVQTKRGGEDDDDGKIESVKVESVEAAAILHAAGHSLYFRGSPELSATLIPALAKDLGFGFTATSIHGESQGEIEIFCAKAGHVTDWHFDFMENFSVQVAGKKKWKLQPSSVPYPVRGCTPHYKTQEVVEQQLKIHRLTDPAFDYHPTFDNVSEVTLEPGSVLYFPAGMWHRVECTEDSITMNLSMFPTPHADIVVDALRHVLLQSDRWRRGVSYDTPDAARAYMTDLLNDLKDQIGKLTAADILPERLLIHGRGISGDDDDSDDGDDEDDDDDGDEKEERTKDGAEGKLTKRVLRLDDPALLEDSAIAFRQTTRVKLNPLASVMHHADIPSIHYDTGYAADDLVYILNVGFGHTSYMSSLRLEFQCSPLQAKLIDMIVQAPSATPFSLRTMLDASKELAALSKKKSETRELLVALHFLAHAGYLTVVVNDDFNSEEG
ncbi:hypothetical protein H310_06610 [Aphanomyces invadans]|uniref:JmjC domain-containing protein n=1 Tax=Aphanomyces invadans TaxID=157072 RepID=A0A024U429_9STRA|nr:hypothetical protein H310_06610 [Aphanomyces invadans]ETW00965.1 hypothetical protein H310_06610 [Aphanomyces invadans]|eukprot:XP_008869963.1 hypothetical protein H310_06610 [Aphanomyces invadans]